MLVYYSILAFLLYFGALNKIAKKYLNFERCILFFSAFVLLFFAAFRSIEIGADTVQYVSHFLKLSETPFSNFSSYKNGWYGDLETGYKIYNKILSYISQDSQTITIANSVLQIGLISILINKESKDKWLSIFLYFTFCFYQTALNLTPSSIASYFMFLAFPFVRERKIVPFLTFVLIGMSFHTSAFFFIPIYFLYNIKIGKKIIISSIVVCVLFITFYDAIQPIIIKIIPTQYVSYIDTSRVSYKYSTELLVYVVQLLAIIFVFILLGKQESKDFIKNNSLMFWVFIYETLLYILATKASMFSRGAFLFSPYTIIIIPEIISQIKSNNKKKVAIFGMVLYGVIVYIARVNVNNVGTTMPYKFFNDLL